MPHTWESGPLVDDYDNDDDNDEDNDWDDNGGGDPENASLCCDGGGLMNDLVMM